jgi:FkbM family methyltransferase
MAARLAGEPSTLTSSAMLRAVARAAYRSLRPVHPIEICGRRLRVPFEARHAQASPDYAVHIALARGRRSIFDVGANTGVLASLMTPNEAALVCFEASEELALVCQRTLALNGIPGSVVNAVVGARSGEPVMFFEWTTVHGFLGHTRGIAKTCLALDDYCRATGSVPDFVKIDVEGGEAGVLRGMVRTLRESRPMLLMELHSLSGHSGVADNARSILPLLWDAGYRMIYLRTGATITEAAQFGTRGRTHVLCLADADRDPEALAGLDTSRL